MLKERRKILKNKIIQRGDIEFQKDRLVEECSELIQAIMKVNRYPESESRLDNLFEELAHVKIMTDLMIDWVGKSRVKAKLEEKITQLERTYEIATGETFGV
jgi:NTP pyrophosphatase (non-canonical NTP hydrolase)